MEFIHTADWHIGNSFGNFEREKREELREAVVSAVRNIFIFAEKNKIPLILAAGDNLDTSLTADGKHLFRMLEIIRNYPDIQVIMIAGNHDPLVYNNIYHSIEKSNYPGNLHFVRNDKEVIDLKEFGIKIIAGSLKEKTGNFSPLSRIEHSDIDESIINVGLFHGSIKNAQFGDNSFPIDADSAEKFGLDYLALGDWHSYNRINERTYYPGCPECLQFGDEGYPLKVTIKERGFVPQVEKITGISNMKWNSINETVSDDSFQEFSRRFKDIPLREIRKAEITGFLSPACYKAYKEILAMFGDRYFEIEDRVHLKPDENQILECTDDILIKNIIKRLFALKSGETAFPDEIRDGLIPGLVERPAVMNKIDDIKNSNIAERALMKIFKLLKEDSGGF